MRKIDQIDRNILKSLQGDGKVSNAALARRLGMSPSTVAERVANLEADGIIRSWRVELNRAKLGLNVEAIISISAEGERCRTMLEKVGKHDAVVSCWRVSGDSSVIAHVSVRDIKELETLVDRLGVYGKTCSSIVLSTGFANRGVDL